MDIDYVYTEGVEQSEIARQFSELMRQRTTLLEEEATPSSCCLPGASFLDPSTAVAVWKYIYMIGEMIKSK